MNLPDLLVIDLDPNAEYYRLGMPGSREHATEVVRQCIASFTDPAHDLIAVLNGTATTPSLALDQLPEGLTEDEMTQLADGYILLHHTVAGILIQHGFLEILHYVGFFCYHLEELREGGSVVLRRILERPNGNHAPSLFGD